MKYVGLSAFICCLSTLFTIGCKDRVPNVSTNESAPPIKDSMMHHMPVGNGNTYQMRILSKPDIIEAGKQIVFSFTPLIVGKETEPVPLDADRGYEIHLIIVNNDLSWFDHRHPGLSDLGTYEQAYTFDKGGVYNLFAEFKPTGSTDTFQVKSFPVNGNSVRPVLYSEPRLTSKAAPFDVTLSPGAGIGFESGKMQMVHASITKDGVEVNANDLGDYLGSKGHMVIISVRDKDFLHVHPTVENGMLVFHTSFSKPGMYRAWLQFQTENIVHTADFVLKVEQSSE